MREYIPKPKAVRLVYKIVQVSPDGRMWSANPNPSDFNSSGDITLVEYKLHHIVYPNTKTPALFCFDSLKCAKECMGFYGRSKGSTEVLVLRGYAFNPRKLKEPNVKSDDAFQSGGCFTVPEEMWKNTVLCSKFIPIQVAVRKVKNLYASYP